MIPSLWERFLGRQEPQQGGNERGNTWGSQALGRRAPGPAACPASRSLGSSRLRQLRAGSWGTRGPCRRAFSFPHSTGPTVSHCPHRARRELPHLLGPPRSPEHKQRARPSKHRDAPLFRTLLFAGLGALPPLGPQSTPGGLSPQEPAWLRKPEACPACPGFPLSPACGGAFGTDPDGVWLLQAVPLAFRGEADQATWEVPWLGEQEALTRLLDCSNPGPTETCKVPTADRCTCRLNTTHSRPKPAGPGPRNQLRALSLEHGPDGGPLTRPTRLRKRTSTPHGHGGCGGGRTAERGGGQDSAEHSHGETPSRCPRLSPTPLENQLKHLYPWCGLCWGFQPS